jgi:hypothetical protein
MRAEAFITA